MNEMAVLKEMLKKLTAEDRERVLTYVRGLQDIEHSPEPAAAATSKLQFLVSIADCCSSVHLTSLITFLYTPFYFAPYFIC